MKNSGKRDILTKLLIFQLLITLEYQTCYQSNAKSKYTRLIVKYEKNIIPMRVHKVKGLCHSITLISSLVLYGN